MRGPVALLLAILPACCPDARPPREASKLESSQTLQLLTSLLAERTPTQSAPEKAEGRREESGKRDEPQDPRKARAKEPAGGDGGAGADEESHVPKPKLTREMIEKSKATAVEAITPESADEQLDLLRKELEGEPAIEPPADPGEEPAPADEAGEKTDDGEGEAGDGA